MIRLVLVVGILCALYSVIGRKQQMIKYKGTTLYPPAMNDVLNDFDNIENHIIEIYTNDLGTDEIADQARRKKESETFLNEITPLSCKIARHTQDYFYHDGDFEPAHFNPMSRKPIHFLIIGKAISGKRERGKRERGKMKEER
jgi:phenylacetate-CoA ligase